MKSPVIICVASASGEVVTTKTMSAIAAHYLGRPATPPIALSLETGWDVLGQPGTLSDEISKLSATERRVLEGVVERIGSMVARNGEMPLQPAADVDRRVMEVIIRLEKTDVAARFVNLQVTATIATPAAK